MERLEMSRNERRRLEVLGRVKRAELTLTKAAQLMKVSYRQAKRIYRRYRRQGDKGLVHRLRGRPSNRKTDAKTRQQILERYQERYGDFGPTLATEYLAKDSLQVSAETLRGWLVAEGLWRKRRKRSAHRSWRPRKEHCGEMLQLDGSHHDWFEGRRVKAVLMVTIDDATNRTYARFFEEETRRRPSKPSNAMRSSMVCRVRCTWTRTRSTARTVTVPSMRNWPTNPRKRSLAGL